MTKNSSTSGVFSQFQTRRDVLLRTGQLGLAGGLPLTLAGCLEIPDNAFRQAPNGAKEIAIQEGRNCWGNQCFSYNARLGEISVTGREPAAVPTDIDLTTGFVSEAEFERLLQVARSADRIARDTGDGGGSSGGRSSI